MRVAADEVIAPPRFARGVPDGEEIVEGKRGRHGRTLAKPPWDAMVVLGARRYRNRTAGPEGPAVAAVDHEPLLSRCLTVSRSTATTPGPSSAARLRSAPPPARCA